MSQTGLMALESTLHTTNVWLRDLMEELGWMDRKKTYRALREVLHALRDRLPVNEVAALGAQLPLLIRGLYYESWKPAGKPLKQHREQFLAHLSELFHDGPSINPEQVGRAVFRILAQHVSIGEIESIKHALPADLRSLWPV
jgi:uncharacterized protein (DUF2267 family)